MKKIFITSLSLLALTATETVMAQNFINKIERGIRTIDNVSNNMKNKEEDHRQTQDKINPQSTTKSPEHKSRQKQILFSSSPSASNANFLQQIDLNNPVYFHVYLEDPLHNLVVKANNSKKYDIVSTYVLRKYYINGQLIASYSDDLGEEVSKRHDLLTEVLVPKDHSEFKDNEMRIGVFAHVFSALSPGVHKLKLEFCIIKNTPKKNGTNPDGGEYDNEEIVVASGEVDVKVDANSVNTFARSYGRPKFSKGVLQGDPTLEKQLVDIIKRETNRDPIYVYASDYWTILRGAYNVITGREARLYYVFKNDKGRCELADVMMYQSYEGNNYGYPRFLNNKFAPAFKYVVCQNY